MATRKKPARTETIRGKKYVQDKPGGPVRVAGGGGKRGGTKKTTPSLFRPKKYKAGTKGNSTKARRLRAAIKSAGGGGFLPAPPGVGPGADHS